MISLEEILYQCDEIIVPKHPAHPAVEQVARALFAPKAAKALKLAIEALEAECALFHVPDEDRPSLHAALQSITEAFR